VGNPCSPVFLLYEGYMQLYKTEWNPYKDAMERWYWDDVTETFTIKNTFDIGDVLKANKAQQNLTIDGRFGNERMHEVAVIPMVFISKLLTDHNLDVFSKDPSEKKRLRQIIERDYPALKTTCKKLWRPK
jgi:hypothetical protein